jgi:SAM-dependent methyltransferase
MIDPMPLRSIRRRIIGRRYPRWIVGRRYPIPLPGIGARGSGGLFFDRSVELAGLTPGDAVLEPGCGTGRMAKPLSRYLTSGSYDGFDVVPSAIEWCEQNIKHPNFRFRHVDVRNRYYNPDGSLDPQTFEFPCSGESFDFAFLTSVFTHMLPPEVRHYLSELRRVLRPGGRCLMTFFLLNGDSVRVRDSGPQRQFAHRGDGYCYEVPGAPEAAVGYREEDVFGFLESAGFELYVPIRYGPQDIVVVNRI